MMLLLGAGLVVGYVILAIAVARFCAVNRGWEEAIDQIPEDLPFEGSQAVGPKRRSMALEA
jgi:hypothetical protein